MSAHVGESVGKERGNSIAKRTGRRLMLGIVAQLFRGGRIAEKKGKRAQDIFTRRRKGGGLRRHGVAPLRVGGSGGGSGGGGGGVPHCEKRRVFLCMSLKKWKALSVYDQ